MWRLIICFSTLVSTYTGAHASVWNRINVVDRAPIPGICGLLFGAPLSPRDLAQMAENEVFTLEILKDLMKIDPGLLTHLDDMNIRGGQLQIGFVEFAGRDINILASAIESRSTELVNTINRLVPPGFPHVAVRHGGGR